MEDREERLREMQEEFNKLSSLVEHAGWKHLQKIAEGQCKNREPEVFRASDGIGALLKKEFNCGEVAGIRLFMQLPGIALESLKQELDEAEESLENDRGKPEPVPTAGGASADDGGDFEPSTP